MAYVIYVVLFLTLGLAACANYQKPVKAERIHFTMTPADLNFRYAKLFSKQNRPGSQTPYKDPRLSLEPIGKTQWLEGIELVKVIDYPPPPIDPQPYDLWVIVNGKTVLPPSPPCAVLKELGFSVQTQNDARKIAQTLAYLHSVRDYYHEDMLENNNDVEKITNENGTWTMVQFTKSIPTQNSLRTQISALNRYEIRLGTGVCEIE